MVSHVAFIFYVCIVFVSAMESSDDKNFDTGRRNAVVLSQDSWETLSQNYEENIIISTALEVNRATAFNLIKRDNLSQLGKFIDGVLAADFEQKKINYLEEKPPRDKIKQYDSRTATPDYLADMKAQGRVTVVDIELSKKQVRNKLLRTALANACVAIAATDEEQAAFRVGLLTSIIADLFSSERIDPRSDESSSDPCGKWCAQESAELDNGATVLISKNTQKCDQCCAQSWVRQFKLQPGELFKSDPSNREGPEDWQLQCFRSRMRTVFGLIKQSRAAFARAAVYDPNRHGSLKEKRKVVQQRFAQQFSEVFCKMVKFHSDAEAAVVNGQYPSRQTVEIVIVRPEKNVLGRFKKRLGKVFTKRKAPEASLLLVKQAVFEQTMRRESELDPSFWYPRLDSQDYCAPVFVSEPTILQCDWTNDLFLGDDGNTIPQLERDCQDKDVFFTPARSTEDFPPPSPSSAAYSFLPPRLLQLFLDSGSGEKTAFEKKLEAAIKIAITYDWQRDECESVLKDYSAIIDRPHLQALILYTGGYYWNMNRILRHQPYNEAADASGWGSNADEDPRAKFQRLVSTIVYASRGCSALGVAVTDWKTGHLQQDPNVYSPFTLSPFILNLLATERKLEGFNVHLRRDEGLGFNAYVAEFLAGPIKTETFWSTTRYLQGLGNFNLGPIVFFIDASDASPSSSCYVEPFTLSKDEEEVLFVPKVEFELVHTIDNRLEECKGTNPPFPKSWCYAMVHLSLKEQQEPGFRNAENLVHAKFHSLLKEGDTQIAEADKLLIFLKVKPAPANDAKGPYPSFENLTPAEKLRRVQKYGGSLPSVNALGPLHTSKALGILQNIVTEKRWQSGRPVDGSIDTVSSSTYRVEHQQKSMSGIHALNNIFGTCQFVDSGVGLKPEATDCAGETQVDVREICRRYENANLCDENGNYQLEVLREAIEQVGCSLKDDNVLTFLKSDAFTYDFKGVLINANDCHWLGARYINHNHNFLYLDSLRLFPAGPEGDSNRFLTDAEIELESDGECGPFNGEELSKKLKGLRGCQKVTEFKTGGSSLFKVMCV